MDTIYRAYSFLNVKAVEGEEDGKDMIISGTATTPTPDRVQDVVEPKGAIFTLPMPLLLYHQNDLPVGHVNFAKPTRNGIPFKATIPWFNEPGKVKERLDEARHSLKLKLITAVSIGFRAVRGQIEAIENGGLRFLQWEWLELSLVTIPANREATIESVKSLDTGFSSVPATGNFERKAGGVLLIPASRDREVKPTSTKGGGVFLIPRS